MHFSKGRNTRAMESIIIIAWCSVFDLSLILVHTHVQNVIIFTIHIKLDIQYSVAISLFPAQLSPTLMLSLVLLLPYWTPCF